MANYYVFIPTKDGGKRFEVPKEVYDYIKTLEVQSLGKEFYDKLTTPIDFPVRVIEGL